MSPAVTVVSGLHMYSYVPGAQYGAQVQKKKRLDHFCIGIRTREVRIICSILHIYERTIYQTTDFKDSHITTRPILA